MAENQTHSNFYGSPCYLQMKKIHSKMKVLEWSQQISYCKSLQLFYDAQGVYLLPARMKKIQSKMKELEWSQHYSLIFLMLKGS